MSEGTNSSTISVAQNFWRQLDVFSPNKFKEEVHIIGAGALGGWIAEILAKMGVEKMNVYDYDRVEDHNLPNQIYGCRDVGKLKLDALKERLARDCRCTVIPHICAVGDPNSDEGREFLEKNPDVEMITPKLSGIVFLCPDKMWVRKFVWDNCIKFQMDVKLMVEGRMGAENGAIHTVNPLRPTEINGFEKTLYSDSQAEQSACTNRAIATTVIAMAALASHKLVKWQAGEPLKGIVKLTEKEEHSCYDMFCVRPLVMTTANWER